MRKEITSWLEVQETVSLGYWVTHMREQGILDVARDDPGDKPDSGDKFSVIFSFYAKISSLLLSEIQAENCSLTRTNAVYQPVLHITTINTVYFYH